ncbi:MAG: hypothetical protein E6J16_04080 [Chloroflexota bacterium]|nr:MAG: hypothetical protein E6J16_04080 [Chloroflexota bacterium]
MEIIRRPVPWLISGVLIGIGFFSAFSGGLLLLLLGLVLAVALFVRRRGRRQGWPALLYGAGVSTAVLLSPYILQPPPCASGRGAGCFQAFTVGTFAMAVVLALTGLLFAFLELRRGPRG